MQINILQLIVKDQNIFVKTYQFSSQNSLTNSEFKKVARKNGMDFRRTLNAEQVCGNRKCNKNKKITS